MSLLLMCWITLATATTYSLTAFMAEQEFTQ